MLCLQCELADLLEASRPPDPGLVDLIEQAFIEGQIDGENVGLAYMWIESNYPGEQWDKTVKLTTLFPYRFRIGRVASCNLLINKKRP